MKLVRATNASSKLKVKIKELGRIVNEGETFNVTDDRYKILAGANRFKSIFVQEVPDTNVTKVVETAKGISVVPKKVDLPKKKEEPKPANSELLNAKIDTQIVDEQPEIWVIEPGKGRIRVDENMNPIKEEEVVEEPPKKKRGRPKKSTVEEKIEEISIQE